MSMVFANRKPLRKKLASLFVTPTIGKVKTVFNHTPASVKGKAPFLYVKSAGSERASELDLRYKGQPSRLTFEVHVGVLYGTKPKPDETPVWDTEKAQDLLDDIEKIVADTVAANSGNTNDAVPESAWTTLELKNQSQIDLIEVEGFVYLHETMFASIDVNASM